MPISAAFRSKSLSGGVMRSRKAAISSDLFSLHLSIPSKPGTELLAQNLPNSESADCCLKYSSHSFLRAFAEKGESPTLPIYTNFNIIFTFRLLYLMDMLLKRSPLACTSLVLLLLLIHELNSRCFGVFNLSGFTNYENGIQDQA